MVFKRMLRAFGVGGPSVDTVIANPTVLPGRALTGQVHLRGGDHDVHIERVALGLVTRVEVESGDNEYTTTMEFHRVQVSGAFPLSAGASHSIPFTLDVPWETPVTAVYGQYLHGMTMGVRTELAVVNAVDKGDLDPIVVEPLPAQVAVLDAVARLGFSFLRADLERGHIRGVGQTLPFYQEIEFRAGPQYAHALNQLEVTFVTNPQGADVILEIDKRGGLFSGGHDVYHRFQVPHHGAEHTDWARVIDDWLQRAVLSHAGRPGGPGGFGYGHTPRHRGGFGAGAMAAGMGAGLVGGFLAAEAVEGVSDAVEGVSDALGDLGDLGGMADLGDLGDF